MREMLSWINKPINDHLPKRCIIDMLSIKMVRKVQSIKFEKNCTLKSVLEGTLIFKPLGEE